MQIIKIATAEIKDADSFHTVFSDAFQFPDYYGRNMNAWIVCMDEFITEPTVIDMGDCRTLKAIYPEAVSAILECAAFVNYRRSKAKQKPVLLISMFT